MNYEHLSKEELISLIKEMKQQSYDNARDLFISNISHDARTLLNSIYGHSQVLSKDTGLSQSHHELIDKILDASSHMIDLINEIIHISKNMGNDKLNLSSFDLNVFISNIHSIFDSLALAKGISIVFNNSVNKDFIIKSDKNKLFYILLNIIGNAIKFTAKGSVVFNCKMITENSVLFEIIDTGIGIEYEMQKKIIQDYIRTNESEEFEGTGLGLSIANKSILALGSELKIQSKKNEGSTFSFEIKCETAKKEYLSTNKKVFEVKTIKRVKKESSLFILIAGKFNTENSILESYLKSKEIDYRIFDKREQLFNFYENNHVDMVLIDTNIGSKLSYLLVNTFHNKDKKLPVIALTASAMSKEIRKISECFTNYIIKPYSFSDLDQSLIFFSGKEFEFEENSSNSKDQAIIIEDTHLKRDILEYAKRGQYKKLSVLIGQVEDKDSKEFLQNHLNNYNFDEIINKIEMAIL